jgi:hypothetical protein
MLKAYLHIIESPSSEDFLVDRREGNLLIAGLKLFNIPYRYQVAINLESFKKALESLSPYNLVFGAPILHISSHGSTGGLQLSEDKSFLTWDELKTILLPINQRMNDSLIVAISSCAGFTGCQMAMDSGEELPFFGLIGPTKNILLNDLALGFLTFYYHILVKGTGIATSVEHMKCATGNPNFSLIRGIEAKAIWVQKIQNIFETKKENSHTEQ